jgi:hypothetical protein
MIQSEFKNKPGHSLVIQKLYHIVNRDGSVINPREWAEIVAPGSSVGMSMMMRSLRVRKRQCPRPGCSGQGETITGSTMSLKWYAHPELIRFKLELMSHSPICDLKFTPMNDSSQTNGRRRFQLSPSTKLIENPVETKSGGEKAERNEMVIRNSKSTNTLQHASAGQGQHQDDMAECRLYKARLHARRREFTFRNRPIRALFGKLRL